MKTITLYVNFFKKSIKSKRRLNVQNVKAFKGAGESHWGPWLCYISVVIRQLTLDTWPRIPPLHWSGIPQTSPYDSMSPTSFPSCHLILEQCYLHIPLMSKSTIVSQRPQPWAHWMCEGRPERTFSLHQCFLITGSWNHNQTNIPAMAISSGQEDEPEAREMAHQSRTLAALPKDLPWVPSIHTDSLQL